MSIRQTAGGKTRKIGGLNKENRTGLKGFSMVEGSACETKEDEGLVSKNIWFDRY
jgi:hypothetical protein